jgi:signal transduction histidine kinase
MSTDEPVSAAMIAHDLRNLLQVTASALLRIDQSLDSTTRERIQRFEHAAAESLARAGALSRALTGIGGTASSSNVVESVCLAQALTTIAPMIELSAGPVIHVAYEVSNDAPLVVCQLADLENTILNLVASAREAMPDGGHVTISLARERSGTLLQVRDTGHRMDAETLGRVFAPFFTTKSASGGSGLGLSIVRAFAERAGGSAVIDSSIGTGTVVAIRLPGMPCATQTSQSSMEVGYEY